MLGYVIQKLF